MGEDYQIFIKFYRILSRVVKGMQTSVVVVILFVCFSLTGSVFSFLYYILLVCIYMYLFIFLFLFCFVLFCFCSLKPLTTADNVQIIHLHKSTQFTLTLSRNYLKHRFQYTFSFSRAEMLRPLLGVFGAER